MGLIKAAMGAAGGVMADQWKEFFYCDSMDKDVMVKKGQKRVSGRSSNTKGSDNIITNGSGIAVADGQCMIIVEQGKIVEVCAEPGQFTFDSSQSHLFYRQSWIKYRSNLRNHRKTIHLWRRYRKRSESILFQYKRADR